MLCPVKELTGYKVRALDGKVGKVADAYIDDLAWFVRYVVVDTGNWLSPHKVLLSPEAFHVPDTATRTIPCQLSKDTIESAPPVETELPVSRQQEEKLRAFYSWPNWWSTPMHGLVIPTAGELIAANAPPATVEISDADPHLRSASEILGYHIEAADGDIGHVDDLLLDDITWAVRYFVLDSKNFLPGKKVIVSPHWISEIRWEDRKVALPLTRKNIEEAPEYDSDVPLERRYEQALYDHYGRPRYW